jgi:hypothetical protein
MSLVFPFFHGTNRGKKNHSILSLNYHLVLFYQQENTTSQQQEQNVINLSRNTGRTATIRRRILMRNSNKITPDGLILQHVPIKLTTSFS